MRCNLSTDINNLLRIDRIGYFVLIDVITDKKKGVKYVYSNII
jgi:hypothetical protein